ncbi:MAG: hypothetical protein ACD_79C00766G0001 [uncultured bacterium]|nr:MAG: hypothetical protein ACD_79C00766G0001 [uncultured bacterium]
MNVMPLGIPMPEIFPLCGRSKAYLRSVGEIKGTASFNGSRETELSLGITAPFGTNAIRLFLINNFLKVS